MQVEFYPVANGWDVKELIQFQMISSNFLLDFPHWFLGFLVVYQRIWLRTFLVCRVIFSLTKTWWVTFYQWFFQETHKYPMNGICRKYKTLTWFLQIFSNYFFINKMKLVRIWRLKYLYYWNVICQVIFFKLLRKMQIRFTFIEI